MSIQNGLTDIHLTVNGQDYSSEILDPRKLLVELLREDFRLTGAEVGCDTNHCGACTVIVNGRAVKSCTILALQANGTDILTVEGLSHDGSLHPIQKAFWQNHSLQCGFCTPGMLMASYELLEKNKEPTEQDIKLAISGVLCRCTGYQNIVKGIKAASEELRKSR